MQPGLDTKTGPKNYTVNKCAIGFGNKHDFTYNRELQAVPGPLYENHAKDSISYISD